MRVIVPVDSPSAGCLRIVLVIWLGMLGVAPTWAADLSRKSDRPNILFILADDLGYGDLGCYGQKTIQTPRLDALAAEGIRFTQCYAGSTVCAPSRCALMTGLHTGHCQVRGNSKTTLAAHVVTVADILKKAGYTTACIGKWGLGDPGTTGIPTCKGFDSFFGFLQHTHAHEHYPSYLWRDEKRVELARYAEQDGVASRSLPYACDLFTRETLAFLEQRHDRPFFLYLAYTTPHANNERGRTEGNGMEVPSDAPYSDRDWPQPQKNHAAMITRLDRDLGRILDKLKERGLDDNTIVFFTSDNGPHKEGGADPAFFQSAGPLRGFKRDLTEGGIRVPCIVRWKGKCRPSVSDHVWAFWDFLPTAADLAGVRPPDGLDGLSIASLFRGEQPPVHEFLYWEFHERGFDQAVRTGNWKYLRKLGHPPELYDLANDLAESRNLADQNPDVIARIEKYLKNARTESKDWPVSPKKN